jgi:hypothetical protein
MTGEKPAMRQSPEFPRWMTPEGGPVSCVEKIKVLNENLAELRDLAQEALEDAVLMGCDETQVREVLAGIVADLVNPYR